MEIGVYLAVISFNDGKTALLQVMKRFGVDPGSSAIKWIQNTDEERLFRAEAKTAAATHEARKGSRKRGYPEDDAYAAGAH